MSSKLKVLVVGASIAGPTAAYWLARAGARVTVIERFPAMRSGGQNIDIRIAGVSVMRKMEGMEPAVRAKILKMDGLRFVRDDGRPYGTLRATGNPDQQSLLSEYEIYRDDLARILFDLTNDHENINYVFGEQVASMQQNEKGDGPISVTFANGHPSSQYDLVVACDGATSRTRAIGLDCGVRDYVSSLNSWSANFSMKKDLLEGRNYAEAITAPGGRFVGLEPDPAGGNRVGLFAFQTSSDHETTRLLREAMKKGNKELKDFVAQHFQGSGWLTEQILEGLMESEDFYAYETTQVKLPAWHKGRFVLVGDAGYAPGPTGGGTTLALAGAYILAGEVSKHKGDLTTALKSYEEQMRPMVTELQKVPPLITTFMAPQTSWGIWLRNHIFAFVTWTGLINFAQRYLAPAFGETNKFPLPEYEWDS